jgi:hypothetical protein
MQMTDKFAPPTDPAYVRLKSLYSFNEQTLRTQFLTLSNQLNWDNAMFAKQHNLCLFRELYHNSIAMPEEIFIYEPDQANLGSDTRAVKMTVAWTTKVATYNLSYELSKVYPGIPWITRYFVISTFPAAFGHFLSEEYLQSGVRFIESHIDDPLASQLLGSLLMHCFLFRDRFLYAFYRRRIQDQTVSNEALLELFLETLRSAVTYLSDLHIAAIRLLRSRNERAAIEAVFQYFLIPTVKLWAWHPLFRVTNLIQKKVGKATSYQTIQYDFILLKEIETLQADEARAASVLDFFVDEIGSPLPSSSKMLLSSGVKFALAVTAILSYCLPIDSVS